MEFLQAAEIQNTYQIKEAETSMIIEVNECKLTTQGLTGIDLLTKAIRAVKLASV